MLSFIGLESYSECLMLPTGGTGVSWHGVVAKAFPTLTCFVYGLSDYETLLGTKVVCYPFCLPHFLRENTAVGPRQQ